MNNESKKDALQEKLMIGKTDGLLGAEKETAEKIGPVLFDLAMDEEKGDGYGSVSGLADAILDEHMPFLACVKYVSDKYMDFRNYLEGKNADRFLAQAALQFYYEDPKDSLRGPHDKETAAFYNEKRKGFDPALKTYADYVETAVARGDIAREKAVNEKFNLHKCFTYVTDRLAKDEDSKDGSITPPSNRSVFFYVRKFFALTEEELDTLYPKRKEPARKVASKGKDQKGKTKTVKKKTQTETLVPVAVDEEDYGDVTSPADAKKDVPSDPSSDAREMPEKKKSNEEQTSGEAAGPEEKDPAEIPSGDDVPEIEDVSKPRSEESLTSAELAGEAAECGESSKAEKAKPVNKKKSAEEKPKKSKKKKKTASCDGQLSFEDFFGF